MNLFDRWFGTDSRAGADDYVELLNQFSFNGFGYGLGGGVQQSLSGERIEAPPANFLGLAQQAYGANGPIFALEMVRMLCFSSVRFTWQRMLQGSPSDLWANDPQLRLLQRPADGVSLQDLMTSWLLDADLAGNGYIAHDDVSNELFRMRPDWVEILLTERRILGTGPQVGWRREGYVYTEGGPRSGNDPVFFPANEVAHLAPIPDPVASYRGMSWITPILNEIAADKSMTRHQRKFFDNGATVNLIVKYEPGTTLEKIKAFKELMKERHTGAENAYKTMHLAPGADPVPVGSNMRQIDFKAVRGAGETRMASAAGVPPIVAGFSEGLEAATYANYMQARRRFTDGTMHPLWENAAASLEPLFKVPAGSRMWYDAKQIPFLREDEKDVATIQKSESETINSLITAGYKPDSVTKAVIAQDWRLLEHSGAYSVQLRPPGSGDQPPIGDS